MTEYKLIVGTETFTITFTGTASDTNFDYSLDTTNIDISVTTATLNAYENSYADLMDQKSIAVEFIQCDSSLFLNSAPEVIPAVMLVGQTYTLTLPTSYNSESGCDTPVTGYKLIIDGNVLDAPAVLANSFDYSLDTTGMNPVTATSL